MFVIPGWLNHDSLPVEGGSHSPLCDHIKVSHVKLNQCAYGPQLHTAAHRIIHEDCGMKKPYVRTNM